MKSIYKAILFMAILFIALAGVMNRNDINLHKGAEKLPVQQQKFHYSYSSLPIHFEQNLGQISDEVSFFSRGAGYTLYIAPTETVLTLKNSKGDKSEYAVIQTSFLNANIPVSYTGNNILPGKVNYLTGKDSSSWLTGISIYKDVIARQIYPGIDLRYHGEQQKLEYDFIVESGVNPDIIKLQFEGINNLSLNDAGDLVLHTDEGELRHKKPVIYQDINGVRISVEGKYLIADNRTVGFQIGSYDAEHSLIIDPVLDYATYLGGHSYDEGLAITVDDEGYTYLAGSTSSLDFPQADSSQATLNNRVDSFITKLSPDGQQLIYTTYIGGTGYHWSKPQHDWHWFDDGYEWDDWFDWFEPEHSFPDDDWWFIHDEEAATGIAVNADGQVTVTGYTNSNTDFPIYLPVQSTYGGGESDIWVAKLNDDGSQLLFSTYLGGDRNEQAYAVALTQDGDVTLVGKTGSRNYPIKDALQTQNAGRSDGVLTQLSADGQFLIFSTFLGGKRNDRLNALLLDGEDRIYVTGETESNDYPITDDAVSPDLNGLASKKWGHGYDDDEYEHRYGYKHKYHKHNDALVSILSADGQALTYSSYLGGKKNDTGTGIALNQDGDILLTGYTHSRHSFPVTENALQVNYGGGAYDAYLLILNNAGQQTYGTYLGGKQNDRAAGIATDGAGHISITGHTQSRDFPIKDPLQTVEVEHDRHHWYGEKHEHGNVDEAFVVHLVPDGTSLHYSTWLGGRRSDEATAIAADRAGNITVTGLTQSHDFPVKSALQVEKGGMIDVFVAKIHTLNTPPEITSSPVLYGLTTASYSYQVIATDIDDDELSYQLIESPEGMEIDAETGEVYWNSPISGFHSVEIEVTDQRAEASQSYTLHINTPPIITSLPVTTTEAGFPYQYDVDAEDPDTGDNLSYNLQLAPAGMTIDANTGLINWTPASIGTVNVSVIVTDSYGESDTQDFVLTVVDTTPPVVTPPANITIEATGFETVVDLGIATATDLVDGSLIPIADNSGPFTVGMHTIVWSATDAAGNTGIATQTVTVTDTTPPVVTAPVDITVEATGETTVVDLGLATAVDVVDGELTPTANNTGPFSVGTHTITWSATDNAGNTGTATQTVTITESTNKLIIFVTEPSNGLLTTQANQMIRGVINETAELTINNEIVTLGLDNSFEYATTLSAGENVFMLIATDDAGNTSTENISVTYLGEEDIKIVSEPETNTIATVLYEYTIAVYGNHTDNLTYTLTTAPAGMSIDAEGNLTWTPTTSGSYAIELIVENDQGSSDTQSFLIEVKTLEEMDAMFNGIWNGMWNDLIDGDKEAALERLTTEAQGRYGPVFDALLPFIEEITENYTTPERSLIRGDVAEYVLRRTMNGQTRLFIIYFVRDDEGNWEISQM